MYIIFDLFGVILSSSFKSSKDRLSGLFNRPAEIIEPVYKKWEKPFDLGKISAKTFWTNINRELGTDINWRLLDKTVLDCLTPVPGSFELLNCFQDKAPLVLLSNTRQEWFDYVNRKYNFSDYFVYKFLSYELKYVKPDPNIFYIVLNELSVKPEKIIYVDDNQENIRIAAGIGLKAFLFENAKQAYLQINYWLNIMNKTDINRLSE